MFFHGQKVELRNLIHETMGQDGWVTTLENTIYSLNKKPTLRMDFESDVGSSTSTTLMAV